MKDRSHYFQEKRRKHHRIIRGPAVLTKDFMGSLISGGGVRGVPKTYRQDSASSEIEIDFDSGMEESDRETDSDYDADMTSYGSSVNSSNVFGGESSDTESLADMSAAEESCSEGSIDCEKSDNESFCNEVIVDSEPDTKNGDKDISSDESDAPANTSCDTESIGSMETDEEEQGSDSESLGSCYSLNETIESIDSVSDDSDIASDSSKDSVTYVRIVEDDADKHQYPVGITELRGHVRCDGCGKKQRHRWLHYDVCENKNIDLCHNCERRGRWCLDRTHQLYDFFD